MKSDTLTKWLTLCANLAILLGLGLVAYELNQNSQLARAAFIHEGNALENQVWANLFGETPAEVIAKAVECPEKMTYADFMAMDAFLFSSMNMVYREYELSREGLFSTEEWKQEAAAYSRWYLGNEFGQAWWEVEGRGFFDPDFSHYIDEQLSEEGGDSYEYWQRIRDRMSSVKGADVRVSESCIPKT
jgi:hypothetical protein